MSELIDNSKFRKDKLKELILKLHKGESPEMVREELKTNLKQIPYGEVVEVEQNLIEEGLPESEVLRLCDIHGEVLEGSVDLSGAKIVPPGHPVDVFKNENREIIKAVEKTEKLIESLGELPEEELTDFINHLLACFNDLMDVDKHYQRKEYLVFPYLEKREITGPPKVMWGKHDEIREQLKGCIEVLKTPGIKKSDLADAMPLLFLPVIKATADMVMKEEEILLPMCMDNITTEEWWSIHKQTFNCSLISSCLPHITFGGPVISLFSR